jgi:parallel beta-helix repeat protein
MGINIVTPNVGGLTIKNLNIKNFSIGIWLWSANNTVVGNAITECIIGVLLEGSTNTITENYIANNKNGVYFGETQAGNISANVNLLENCFVNNLRQLSGCVCIDYNTTEPIHTWDNGTRGNFWSDYNGTDSNGDGIGDAPYVIDVLNQDRYPLMQSTVTPPTPAPKTPIEIIVLAVALPIIAVVAVIAFTRRRKQQLET